MRFFRKYSTFQSALVLLALFLYAIQAHAQEAVQPEVKDSRTNTVMLNVLVTDKSKGAVTDLQQGEVRVLEDGKEQAITHFSLQELPVSYGIMVDASGSMRELFNHLIETGRSIVASNKPEDEAFVLRFVDGDSIQVEEGFTSDKDALYEALDGIYVEGGQTALMDAINRAAEYHRKNRRGGGAPRRHAIVLITDGEDRGSQSRNLESILPRLREDDIQFFVVGLTNLSAVQGSREKAINFLTRLAELSGGRAFFPKSPTELPNIVAEIARDLHTQYLIGYTSTNKMRDGSFRKVQVIVPDSPSRKKLNVITRPGYISREAQVNQP